MIKVIDIVHVNTNRLALGAPQLYISPDTITSDQPSSLARVGQRPSFTSTTYSSRLVLTGMTSMEGSVEGVITLWGVFKIG